MKKTLIVAWREFRHQVRTRGFLFTSIGTPLMLMVMWALVGAFDNGPSKTPLERLMQANLPEHPIGYVDQANLVRRIPENVPADLFRAFPDLDAADTGLERGEIDGYYVVLPDYRETGAVQRVSSHIPTMPADVRWFEWILIANLLPDQTPEQVARLRWPFQSPSPEFVSLNAEGETGTEGRSNVWLPFLVAAAVVVPLFTSGGYLLQSVTQEKSSRVMEILLVSLRPYQLLAGKLLGLGTLTLVQYACWLGITWLGVVIAGSDATQMMASVSFSTNELVLVVPYALGGFVLYASVMAGIGALAPDLESSRAWVFVISLPMLIPIYLWLSIATSPNGTLAVVLSLIPFSAPVAMLMRMTSTSVPIWQVGLSLILLAIAAAEMIRFMARLFRVQTLLSGEAISVRRLWAAMRG